MADGWANFILSYNSSWLAFFFAPSYFHVLSKHAGKAIPGNWEKLISRMPRQRIREEQACNLNIKLNIFHILLQIHIFMSFRNIKRCSAMIPADNTNRRLHFGEKKICDYMKVKGLFAFFDFTEKYLEGLLHQFHLKFLVWLFQLDTIGMWLD